MPSQHLDTYYKVGYSHNLRRYSYSIAEAKIRNCPKLRGGGDGGGRGREGGGEKGGRGYICMYS